jgi:putative transcriptional regulator
MLCLHNESLIVHNMSRTIFNRIALFRADRGMTRRELADRVGVNPQTVGFLERGDYSPSLELALAIAEVFAVPVDMLFAFRPFPPLAGALAGSELT